MSNPALERLLQHPALFLAGQKALLAPDAAIPTGYPELDNALPWAGWPRGKLIEIIPEQVAIGEFTLLTPALAIMTREGQALVLIDPPQIPYAPALAQHQVQLERVLVTICREDKEQRWTVEQCLKSGACGAVLAWEQASLDDRSLRRWQLAAEAGNGLAFVFRNPRAARQASPAKLRLWLAANMNALSITVLKGQGASGETLTLALHPTD